MYIIKTYDDFYNEYYYKEPYTKLYGFYTKDINNAHIFKTRKDVRTALKIGKEDVDTCGGELSKMLKHEHAVKVVLLEEVE